MSPIVIEYVLDSRRPGYTLRANGSGLSDDHLKTVWRRAIPRGQGWGAEAYLGARSLKCFPLDSHTAALSEVVVTGQQDEEGRRGIRRAEISPLPAGDLMAALRRRLASYPDPVRVEAGRRLTLGVWKRIVDSALPRMKGGAPQIVLAHPYENPDQWRLVEALVLHLATAWPLHTIPGWGRVVSFTTLALTHLDEARIVALPLERARQITECSVIEVP